MNFWRSSQLVAQARVVGQLSVGCLKRGQPCLHQLHVLSTAFSGGLYLHLAFRSFFYPHPSPLPPGAIALGVRGWKTVAGLSAMGA